MTMPPTVLALLLAAASAAAATGGPVTTTTFTTPGTKTVTLKVCNAAGCSSVSKRVTVLDPAPRIVSETVPATVGTASPPVTFSAVGAGRSPLTYRWSLALSDGTSLTAGGPSFTWSPVVAGSHQLTLNLSNLYGSQSASRTLSVIPNVFADVPPDFWAADSIEAIYFAGLTSGCAVDTAGRRSFCPDGKVSRAEMAVFLGRARHPAPYSPAPAIGIFQDVPPSFWAAPWIEQASRDGLTSGCSASGNTRYFCPADFVTRAETAVFLERASHSSGFSPPPPSGLFVDVPVTYWAAAWIEQLARDGHTAGCGANGPLRFFCPANTLTRAEMAVFLSRVFHASETPPPLTFLAHLCSLGSCTYPAGMPIDFNLQLSGGIPTSYDYDWNGDGVFEETAVFPKPHTYLAPGVYLPRVRLRRGSVSTTLAHPYSITVMPSTYGSPLPPASISVALVGSVPPGSTDPPGTLSRVAYSINVPPQSGVLGYAAFVNPGTLYQFIGLLQPSRATATDRLLLPPTTPGVVRFLYLRAFNGTGYGPSSLPVRLP